MLSVSANLFESMLCGVDSATPWKSFFPCQCFFCLCECLENRTAWEWVSYTVLPCWYYDTATTAAATIADGPNQSRANCLCLWHLQQQHTFESDWICSHLMMRMRRRLMIVQSSSDWNDICSIDGVSTLNWCSRLLLQSKRRLLVWLKYIVNIFVSDTFYPSIQEELEICFISIHKVWLFIAVGEWKWMRARELR